MGVSLKIADKRNAPGLSTVITNFRGMRAMTNQHCMFFFCIMAVFDRIFFNCFLALVLESRKHNSTLSAISSVVP